MSVLAGGRYLVGMLASDVHTPAHAPAAPPPPLAHALVPHLHRWTVRDYRAMRDAGLLEEGARTELVEGQIITMSPIGALHLGFQSFLHEELQDQLDRKVHKVIGQNPLDLDEYNEPEPDVYVLPYRADHYTVLKPTAEDAILVCEVSVSTLDYDLGDKRDRYARFGIPEYWVIDPERRVLHYFDTPSDVGYRRALVLDGEDAFESKLLGGTTAAAWMPPAPELAE